MLTHNNNYVWWPRRLLSEALPTSAIITEIPTSKRTLPTPCRDLPTSERTAL